MQSLYNFKCPQCLESGFADKLARRNCIHSTRLKTSDTCPWCRGKFDPAVQEYRDATRVGNVVGIIRKEKKCLMTQLSHCLQPSSTPFMGSCSTWLWISNRLLFHGAVGMLGVIVGVCMCGGTSCWICTMVGCFCSLSANFFFTLYFNLDEDQHHL